MEQKMLLPIIVVVLVGGFLIGYYAATAGSGISLGKKAAAKAEVSNQATLLNTDVEDQFVLSATYIESVVGYIQSMTEESITLTREGKAVTILLPKGNTVVMNYVNGNKIVVPSGFPKPNDYVNVKTFTNADNNQLQGVTVTVIKRAA